MSDPHQIDRDLRDYLDKEQNLLKEDKISFLMTIFQKHLSISKLNHNINYYDLTSIVSTAVGNLRDQSLPMYVSGKKIDPSLLTAVAMIDSVSSYLNRNNLAKRVLSLDLTDNSAEYEGLE